MKKILLILCLLVSINIKASSNITVSIDKKTVTANQSFNLTATIKESDGIGTLHYEIIYDKEALKLNEGDEANIITASNNNIKKVDIKANFIALKEGKHQIKFNIIKALSFDMEELNFDYSYPLSITVNKAKSVSSNNYLKSLTIKGAKIAFHKDTFTYDIVTESENLEIKAEAEDKNASVVIENNNLKDGNNIIKIKVYAENGVLRLYEINALKKPSKKIKIKYLGKDYYVSPEADFKNYKNFIKQKIKINGEEVEALYNEELNTYIIHIFNDNHNFDVLYKNNKTSKLNYIEHSNLYLLIKEYKGRHSKKVKINGKEFSVKKDQNYYYFYAYDLENNKENIYRFDGRSIQEEIKKKDMRYLYIIIPVIILNILGFIFLSRRRKNA